jgi:hypothetical protein
VRDYFEQNKITIHRLQRLAGLESKKGIQNTGSGGRRKKEGFLPQITPSEIRHPTTFHGAGRILRIVKCRNDGIMKPFKSSS